MHSEATGPLINLNLLLDGLTVWAHCAPVEDMVDKSSAVVPQSSPPLKGNLREPLQDLQDGDVG